MKAKRIVQILTLLFALAGLAFSVWLLTQKGSPFYQPINEYKLVSPLKQLSEAEVHNIIRPHLGRSFWEIPLDKIQAELVRMDWVESAEVRRKWPDQLYIAISEQKPVARWNKDGLINGLGKVFFPSDLNGFDDYVQLEGQLAQSPYILEKFVWLQTQFDTIDKVIAHLTLQNDVWRIKLLNGTSVVVDTEHFRAKIERFIRAYPKVDKTLRKSAQSYDLRYSNGFIISES